MTISNKITLMYGVIFAIFVLVVNAVIFVNLYMFYRDISRNEVEETVEIIANHIRAGGEITQERINALIPYKYVSASVTDAGEAIRQYPEFGGKTDGERIPPPAFFDSFAAQPPENGNGHGGFMARIMNTGFSQILLDYNATTYLITTSRSFEREIQIFRVFQSLFALFNMIGVAGAFLVGRYISRKMLRPITDMIKLASEISIDDLSKRIEIDGPDDEINLLGKTFNDMICRLSVSFEKQSRFVSDASHELRTPISVIQGYANLLARWGKDDPAILQESIESIKSETERMITLVKKLLFMAGDDNFKQTVRDYICLNDCLRDILKEIQVMDLPHEIKFEEKTQINIYADADLMRQMLWIFIENSMKYSKNGKAEITIRMYADDINQYVSIKDNGIGIKEKDLPFVFERFYRGDKARSQIITGTGLGLSIVDRIIKAHNAKVSITSKQDLGTEVIVSFEK
jgi:signal transduction histidine kinase